MAYERFTFMGSWRDTVEALPTELGNKVLRAIVNYGTAYEAPVINPNDPDSAIVYAIMQSIIPIFEKAKTNYENASHGGRPMTATQEDFDKCFDKRMSNKEIAEYFNCSTKTVERRKKIWKEKQSDKATEKDTAAPNEKDTDIEMEKDTDMDRVGFVGFVGFNDLSEEDKKALKHEKTCWMKEGKTEEEAERLAYSALFGR